MNALGAQLDRLLSKRSQDRELDVHIWVLLDFLHCLLYLTYCSTIEKYEILVLGLLDIFLFTSKDDRQKVVLFHNSPKIYFLHLKNPILLTSFTTLCVLLHLCQHLRTSKAALFIMGVNLSVYISSYGITKIISLSFVTAIMASYMYLWEFLEPNQASFEDLFIKPDDDSTEDDNQFKDQAIAQDLVGRLKKLKVAMIIQQEREKKNGHMKKERESRDSGTRRKDNSKRVRRAKSVILYDCEEVSCRQRQPRRQRR